MPRALRWWWWRAAAYLALLQAALALPQQQPWQQDGAGLEYAPMWGWYLPSASDAPSTAVAGSQYATAARPPPQQQQQQPSPGGAGVQYATAARQPQQPQQQQPQQLSPPGTLQYPPQQQQPPQQQATAFSSGRQQYPLESTGSSPSSQHAVGRYGALDSAAGAQAIQAPGRPQQAGTYQPVGWPAFAGGQMLSPAGQVLRPAGQTLSPAGQTLRPAGQALSPAGQQVGQLGLAVPSAQPGGQQPEVPGQRQGDGSSTSAAGLAESLKALLSSKAAFLGEAVRGGVRAVLWLPGVILDKLRGVQTTAAR